MLNAEVFADVGPDPDQLVELFDALTDLRRAAGDFELARESRRHDRAGTASSPPDDDRASG